MNYKIKTLFAGTSIAFIAGAAHAATFDILSDPADYLLSDGLTTNITSGGGTTSSGSETRNHIYVFELPTLAAGEFVSSANFKFTVSLANGTPNHNLDLWGIGFESSTTPLLEYFDGNTGDVAGNVKIQDNLVALTDPVGDYNTDAAADTILASYIQGFYDANASYSGGSYVFLRVNPDATPDGGNVDRFGMRFNEIGVTAEQPFLTLETATIPEPWHGGLIMLTVSMVFTYYRRKNLKNQ